MHFPRSSKPQIHVRPLAGTPAAGLTQVSGATHLSPKIDAGAHPGSSSGAMIGRAAYGTRGPLLLWEGQCPGAAGDAGIYP